MTDNIRTSHRKYEDIEAREAVEKILGRRLPDVIAVRREAGAFILRDRWLRSERVALRPRKSSILAALAELHSDWRRDQGLSDPPTAQDSVSEGRNLNPETNEANNE